MTGASQMTPDPTTAPASSPRSLVDWLFTGRPGPALVAACGLLAFVVVVASPAILNDGDTFWHLATGEWILRHMAVPTTDPFSYTFAGAPWQAHEWLSEALMALVYRTGGWSGVTILFAGAFGATALILSAYLARWLAAGPLMVATIFALASGAPNWLARPHLLALPLFAVWLVGMLKAREEDRAPSWLLLPVMLVWANLHGGFVLGLALVAPFALEALIAHRRDPWVAIRAWAPFGLAALVVSMATPHGWAAFSFALKVTQMTSLPIISEWRSLNISKTPVFEVALLEGLFFCLWRGVRVPAIRLILLLLLFYLALQHIRNLAIFALAAAVLLAEPFARSGKVEPSSRKPQAPLGGAPMSFVAVGLAVVLAAACAWRLMAPIVRSDEVNAPVSALAAVPPVLAARPVFNEYGYGGYLIFKGVRPFIDGRADMYGDAFMHTYDAMTRPELATLKSELARRHVEWTILSVDNPAVAALDALPEWRRLHADRIAVVHVRRGAEQ